MKLRPSACALVALTFVVTGAAAFAGGDDKAAADRPAKPWPAELAKVDAQLTSIEAGVERMRVAKTDAARDGKSSADDTYKVVAPTLLLAKSSKIISDPFNGTTNPKRIPGATIEYCIVATNTGAGAASSAVISDSLASVTGVTYLNGSIFTGVTVSSGTCNSDGTLQTDAVDGDQSNFASNTVTSNLGTINGGASSAIRFRVTIN